MDPTRILLTPTHAVNHSGKKWPNTYTKYTIKNGTDIVSSCSSNKHHIQRIQTEIQPVFFHLDRYLNQTVVSVCSFGLQDIGP